MSSFVLNFDAWNHQTHHTKYYVCNNSKVQQFFSFEKKKKEKTRRRKIKQTRNLTLIWMNFHTYKKKLLWNETENTQQIVILNIKLRQTNNCKINRRTEYKKPEAKKRRWLRFFFFTPSQTHIDDTVAGYATAISIYCCFCFYCCCCFCCHYYKSIFDSF